MRKLLVVVVVVGLALLAFSGTAGAQTTDLAAGSGILAAQTPAAAQGRGWLGLGVANLNEKIAERLKFSQKEGVVVISVAAKGPAATAGVKVGDLVTAVNGVAVKTAKDAISEAQKSKPGDKLTLSLTRGSESLTVNLTAATAPKPLNRLQELKKKVLPSLPPELNPLKDVPAGERFGHTLGATLTYTDKDGNVVAIHVIPGVVTAISPASITITPNNAQSRGGPFSIDGATRILFGLRSSGTYAIAVNDKVTVVVVGNSSHASLIVKGPLPTNLSQFLGPLGGKNNLLPQRKPGLLPGNILRNRLPQAAPGSGA